MKSFNLSSMISPNNSVALIIFVFMFIAVGMFFLIQKTTEKQNQEKEKVADLNSLTTALITSSTAHRGG